MPMPSGTRRLPATNYSHRHVHDPGLKSMLGLDVLIDAGLEAPA
jgi:hypothetical protein